jgi:hypothetical protein
VCSTGSNLLKYQGFREGIIEAWFRLRGPAAWEAPFKLPLNRFKTGNSTDDRRGLFLAALLDAEWGESLSC